MAFFSERLGFKRALRLGAALAVLASAPGPGVLAAQVSPAAQACGRVETARHTGVASAELRNAGHALLAVTGGDGGFCIPGGVPGAVTVTAPGYQAAQLAPGSSLALVTLLPDTEQVEVTAYRSPLASLDSPASTRVLGSAALAHAASPSLDGKLRQVPGFELFRRTSSLVANPTTEGVSLRGLGSTAASRTLVVSNDVPLNDPYGGWIHWNEIPALAIHSVEVVRGGASDLYGSSAIGGVINVIPVQPAPGNRSLSLMSGYGAEATTDNGALGSISQGRWSGLAAAGLTATDGYILVAPNLRGLVDTPSNVHAENGLVEVDRALGEVGSGDRLFLRGNMLNESRHNGTPDTTNATRLWRYSAGADVRQLTLRAYGSSEHYRQGFSSVAVGRGSETFTRAAEDPASELGAAARWQQPVGTRVLVLAGADTRDIRAADYEFPTSGVLQSTTARQRQTGEYVELLATPRNWTLSASGRVDHFTNNDALQYTLGSATKVLPNLSETVVDPRLGITRRITPTIAVNASAFRAYRAPTENELYRNGQVGQQNTLANPDLKSERATGWETGIATEPARWGTSLRASYFWTQVNRPITALTLSTTPTATLLMRENLGQIESRGVSLDASVHPVRWLALVGGYQFARATVTKYAQEPFLVGNWIPQVARNMATLQATASSRRLGLLSLQTRTSGRQFDDDANHFVLHSYVRFDVYASRGFGKHAEVFATVENLLDRSIDAGRTPIRTLGTPQLARFGVKINFGE